MSRAFEEPTAADILDIIGSQWPWPVVRTEIHQAWFGNERRKLAVRILDQLVLNEVVIERKRGKTSWYLVKPPVLLESSLGEH